MRFVERKLRVRLPSGRTEPRMLVTYVRYPARGRGSRGDLARAPAELARGPFPLVVFGHGYATTPALHTRLLRAWARAGYVVAAPVFPLENANAPGGPDERDLVNQPHDMRVVISRMLTESSAGRGPLRGLIDPKRVAVAGHSDGGDTALAVAYDRHFHDHRVKAAVILSGAEIPGVRGFRFPRQSPPLLAVQGTADTVNPPSDTRAFYDLARRPKYLLALFGAGHEGPYSDQQPQLRIVKRVTITFLNRYLKGHGATPRQFARVGTVRGISSLRGVP